MPLAVVVRSSRTQAPVCALCREEDPQVRCHGCGTLTHRVCLNELTGVSCPTLGCSQPARPQIEVTVGNPVAEPPDTLGVLFSVLAWASVLIMPAIYYVFEGDVNVLLGLALVLFAVAAVPSGLAAGFMGLIVGRTPSKLASGLALGAQTVTLGVVLG